MSDPLTPHLYRIYMIKDKKKNTRDRSINVSDICEVMFAMTVSEVSSVTRKHTI